LEAPFANGAQERVPAHDGIAIGQAFVSHGWLYPYSKSGDTGTPVDYALYHIVVAYHTPTHGGSRNIPAVFPSLAGQQSRLARYSSSVYAVCDGQRPVHLASVRYVWCPLAGDMHSDDFQEQHTSPSHE
jgi:hypothetical protein